MGNQRNKIIDLRPSIPTIIEEKTCSSAEQFQNRSLRPILKFQNELLLDIFRHYIEKRKGIFHQLTLPKKKQYIEDSIRKDQKFKQLLLGTSIGQFTVDEWKIYREEEKEMSRRLTNLLIQRLQDQVGSITNHS